MMKSQAVSLDHIDFNDLRFSLLPAAPMSAPEKLRKSISRIGILHPPILYQQGDGHFLVVSGRRRLLAAKSLHQRSCQCRVLDETTPPLDIYGLLLEERLFSATFTIAEQAVFLQRVLAWLSKEEAARRFLPVMGLSAHVSQLDRLLRLTRLEEVILMALHRGELDRKVAYELQKLSFHNRMALFEIITALKLSVSNQKKLLLICRELALRQKMEIAEFLSEQSLQDILNQQGNIPLVTRQFFARLHELRFPRVTAAEEEFADRIKSLRLPANCRVNHAPFFEKDEIELTMTFANQQELVDFCQNTFKVPSREQENRDEKLS